MSIYTKTADAWLPIVSGGWGAGAEVEAEMVRLEAAAVEAQAADAAARESAVAKLAALGLNDAEIKAIIGEDLEA